MSGMFKQSPIAWARLNLANLTNYLLGANLVGYLGATLSQWLFGPVAYGADATGITDSRTAIIAADVAAALTGRALIFKAGTYKISGTYTFTAPVRMEPGAKLIPSGATTLNFSAGFYADLSFCLDPLLTVTFKRISFVYPHWFGADDTGAADSTAAMNAAHATGRTVYYPRGSYVFSAISFAEGGIVSDAADRAVLSCSDTGALNAITVTGNTPVIMYGFELACSGSKTGGRGIYFNTAIGEANRHHVERVDFVNFKTQLEFLNCVYFNVCHCFFNGHTTGGLIMADTVNPDGGDANIHHNIFVTGAAGFGLIWRSGGGVRISHNKFLNGANGIFVKADLPTSTSDIFIENNSIENQTGSGISLARNSGAGGIASISINGNQFNGVLTPVQGSGIPASFISDLQIVNNQFQLVGGTGVTLANVTDPTVTNNKFNVVSGTPIGINIAATCTGGLVGHNTFRGAYSSKVTMSSTTVNTVGGAGVATVASAAAISLPLECDVFIISGVTNITAIGAGGWAGRTIMLIFSGILTLTDGGNLRLSANFATTADDAITLSSDGTNWYEGGRSVN